MTDIIKQIHENNPVAKWVWKMNYCNKRVIPHAAAWAWNEAEEQYNIEFNINKEEIKSEH